MRLSRGIKACVLVSGGMDSAVLTAELLKRGCEVHPLYVREGLRWERAELFWLKRWLKALARPKLKPLSVIDVPVRGLYGRHWAVTGPVPAAGSAWDSVYLPGRNVVLLAQAGVFCGLKGLGVISQGVLKGNPFPDASPAFRASMQRTLTLALGRPLKIEAPFSKLDKAAVARLGKGLPLKLTFSCIDPKGLKHCGRCTKCEERAMGLGDEAWR